MSIYLYHPYSSLHTYTESNSRHAAGSKEAFSWPVMQREEMKIEAGTMSDEDVKQFLLDKLTQYGQDVKELDIIENSKFSLTYRAVTKYGSLPPTSYTVTLEPKYDPANDVQNYGRQMW